MAILNLISVDRSADRCYTGRCMSRGRVMIMAGLMKWTTQWNPEQEVATG